MTVSMDQDFIQKLTRTVFENLNSEQFGAEELAHQIGLSRSQIHRRLHQIKGQSITQFIREIRLKEAHRLLKINAGTASEIAYQVGFGSPTYFNKCFHEYYGYTPGELKGSNSLKTPKKKIHSFRSVWISGGIILLLAIVYSSIRLTLDYSKGHIKAEEIKSARTHNPSVEKSLVVIPFTNLSDDPNQDYFCNGMVDEIITHLIKVSDIIVKRAEYNTRFTDPEFLDKEIGKAFNVTYILRGSASKAGDSIRITPQLIDVASGAIIWSDSYEENIADLSKVFSIQKDVAQNVAIKLKSKMGLRGYKRYVQNTLAYEYFLKGNEYDRSGERPVLALESYSKAIKEDSFFVAAYARKAIMHARLYHIKITEDWVIHDQLAQNSIDKAKQLDSENIEVKIAQAMYHYYIDLDCNLGISILNDLEDDAPNMSRLYAYRGNMKGRQGKWEDCIQELNHAIKLEPFNVSYIITLSSYYERLRDFDKSIEIARQGLEKVPDHIGFRKRIFTAMRKKTGNLDLAMAESGLDANDIPRRYYYHSGQFDKLIEYIKKEDFSLTYANNFHPKHHELAHAYFFKGDTVMSRIYADSAIQLLEKMLVENPLDHRLQAPLSKCYAFLGEREKAIEYGKQSISAMPVEDDAIRGIGRETELLKTYALLGENDLALNKIEELLLVPGWLTYGDLLTRPEYYGLRDHPRFQKIIAQGKDLQIAL